MPEASDLNQREETSNLDSDFLWLSSLPVGNSVESTMQKFMTDFYHILSKLSCTHILPMNTIQGVSRLWGITAGGDFLGLCDEKSSYKHVSDFGRLRSYDRLKLRIEGNDY